MMHVDGNTSRTTPLQTVRRLHVTGKHFHRRDFRRLAPQGLSLVELLIAMTLGLILISGVIVVFVGSKRSSDIASAMSDMQENGRFALNALASDIRMAGYQGCFDANRGVVTIIADDSPTTDLKKTAISGAIVKSNSKWEPPLALGVATAAITAPTKNKPVPGTHTLAVQFGRANDVELAGPLAVGGAADSSGPIKLKKDPGLQSGDLAIISNCEGGELFEVTGVASDAGGTSIAHGASKNSRANFEVIYGSGKTLAQTQVMPFVTHVYYIGDTGRKNESDESVSALYLQSMPFNSASNPPVELIDGVEDMRVTYGISASGGRVKYVDASGIGSAGDNIQSVRVGLLLVSLDQVSEQKDTRNYVLAGTTISSATKAGTADTYVSDRRLRLAFNTTVKVRNRRASN